MALDRFVYWNEKKPTNEELHDALMAYLGGVGECTWGGGRWNCTLPGQPTPTSGEDPSDLNSDNDRRRFIEVFIHDYAIDVITRHADDFTNAIAEGFARFCVRRWRGRYKT